MEGKLRRRECCLQITSRVADMLAIPDYPSVHQKVVQARRLPAVPLSQYCSRQIPPRSS